MYELFRKKMADYIIFSTDDIIKIFPNFDKKALVRWQLKKYITKIRNNHYCFNTKEYNEEMLFYIANKIYRPSYISLESALSFYGIIPEGVYTITSITTTKTNIFGTPVGIFSYKSVKESLFVGYKLIEYNGRAYKMAELEKSILDYIYLNKKITTSIDFSELRWNKIVLKKIDITTFKKYLRLFNSSTLNKRAEQFLIYIYD